jgi:hypothetical protein
VDELKKLDELIERLEAMAYKVVVILEDIQIEVDKRAK